MNKKSGVTLAMLIIYIVVLVIIMGSVIANLVYNNEIDELDKAVYQSRISDYIEQFETMKNYYLLIGEFDDEICISGVQQDIYGRKISDYVGSITGEDLEYLCIYNGELHFYGLSSNDARYNFLIELGLASCIFPSD